ncbi:ComEC family competence protein, partial [bacterium]|nr:ComEC family competence protein [bacterium]
MTAATASESSAPSLSELPFILLKRPCLLLAGFLIPGIVIGHHFLRGRVTVGLLVPLGACLFVALLLLAAHSTFSTPATMLVVFGIGILLGAKCGVLPPRHVHFTVEPGRMHRVRGVVVGEPVALKRPAWWRPTGKERFSFTLEATQVCGPESEGNAWGTVRGKILVYTSAAEAGQLQYGDKVKLTGEAFLPNSRRNPGGFDFRKYLAERGVYLCMKAATVGKQDSGHGSPIHRLVYRLKAKLRDSFSAGGIGKEEESFLRAIILGERREVGEEFKEALRRTNTMHILAISGLHVGIIAGAMYFFLSRLLFARQGISSLATIIVLFAYALLTGMRPPVMRASVMCTVFLMAPLLKRRLDSINSLAFAAVVILFIRPGDLFTTGFQLSFMVVLSILLLADKIFYWCVSAFRLRPDPGFLTVSAFRRSCYRRLEWPLSLFSVCLAAFFGFAPLGLYYFHRISFLSPVWNVFTLFLVLFIVPLGFLGAVIGLLWQGVAGLINSL